jgi:hypothetical protein
MQVQTISFETPIQLTFNHSSQTLVIMMITPVMSEGYIGGGGQQNSNIYVDGKAVGQTFIGGDCKPELEVSSSENNIQWYVRLHGTSTYQYSSTSKFVYDGVIVGIVIMCLIIVVIVMLSLNGQKCISNRDSRHVIVDEEVESDKSTI